MMRFFIPAVLLCLSITTIFAQTDYSYYRNHTYTIEKNGSIWEGTSVEEVTMIYRSTKALKESVFHEYSSVYRTINNVEAWVNGKKLPQKWVTKSQPIYRDVFLTDSDVWSIESPKALSIGDTLRYIVHRTWFDISHIPLEQVPNYNETSEFTLSVIHPDDISIHGTVFPVRSHPIPVITKQGQEQTTITFKNLHYQTSLSGFPFNDVHCLVRLDMFENGVPINNTTPALFAEHYKRQFNQICDLSPEQRSKILEFCNGAKNQLDTIRALHDYVRTSIRYVSDERSINAYVPRMPSVVMQQKYGDCKDRAHFVSSLSRSLGYNVGMALIHTQPQPVRTNTVHLGQFNHVICYAIIDADTIYFDPTAEHSALSDLPQYDTEQPVFLIHANPPSWAISKREQAQPLINVDVDLNALLPDSAEAKITLRKDLAITVSYLSDSETLNDKRIAISNILGEYFNRIKVFGANTQNESDTLVAITAMLDFKQYLVKGNSSVYFPLQPARLFSTRLLERETDSLPIFLDAFTDVLFTFHITNANFISDTSYTLTGPGKSLFSVSVKKKSPTSATVIVRSRIGSKYFANSERKRLLEFIQSYTKQKKLLLTLSK